MPYPPHVKDLERLGAFDFMEKTMEGAWKGMREDISEDGVRQIFADIPRLIAARISRVVRN